MPVGCCALGGNTKESLKLSRQLHAEFAVVSSTLCGIASMRARAQVKLSFRLALGLSGQNWLHCLSFEKIRFPKLALQSTSKHPLPAALR